jgi:hypothetical protein
VSGIAESYEWNISELVLKLNVRTAYFAPGLCPLATI